MTAAEVLVVRDVPVPDASDGRVVRVLRMDRPDARNAMDTALLSAVVDALDAAERDDRVAGLLLTGGPTTFSAGADVRERTADGGRRRMELFTHLYERLSLFGVPTAAAVEGPAVGGGAEAAGCCDVRIVGASLRLRFPGVAFGLPVGPARLVGLVGLGTARDWVLSARDVDAEEAHRAGFAQRVVPDGATQAAALEWLQTAAGRRRDTARLLKRVLLDFGGVRDRVAWENDALRATVESGHLPPDLDQDLPRTVRPRRR